MLNSGTGNSRRLLLGVTRRDIRPAGLSDNHRHLRRGARNAWRRGELERKAKVVECTILQVSGDRRVEGCYFRYRWHAGTFAHFGVETDFANVRSHIGEGGDRLMATFLGEATPEARQDEIQRYRTDLFKRQYLSEIRAFPRVRDPSNVFERTVEGSS